MILVTTAVSEQVARRIPAFSTPTENCYLYQVTVSIVANRLNKLAHNDIYKGVHFTYAVTALKKLSCAFNCFMHTSLKTTQNCF